MIGGISSTDASAATTNVIKQPQQPPCIVVPDIRTEQVYDILGGHSSLSSEVATAANSTTKLLSSQPTNNKSVHSESKFPSKNQASNWLSQSEAWFFGRKWLEFFSQS